MTIRRQLAFARHVPPGKLAARIWLQIKRQTLARASRAGAVRNDGLRREADPLRRAPSMPWPLAPHAKASREADGGFSFEFIGRREQLGFPIDWHRPELQSGTKLWLLNLHYMEYLHALADQDFVDLILDWIDNNPCFGPGYWTYNWNSYALSIRVVSIMRELTNRASRLDEGDVSTILRSLTNQMDFLRKNIERDIGGNHLIKNIKALACGASFFQSSASDRWRRLALELLEAELPKQILADGFHYELSPSYHAQVFADLLTTRIALGEDAASVGLDAVLHRMAQPLADLSHPDGGPALFNDAGMTMAHAPAICLSAYVASGGAMAVARPGFAFPDAGYYGLRNDLYYLAVDAGRIGPDDLPAHAHGDVGSFELSVGGERFIIDPGVFEYSSGERRMLSRSAASHNVLSIRGRDQAEFFGAFRCGRRPDVTARSAFTPDRTALDLECSHNGYGFPTRRRIEAGERTINVHDMMEGAPEGVDASVSFLLAPEASPSRDGDGVAITRGGAVVVVRSDLPIEIGEAVCWPDMGVERPTRRLRLSLPPGCASVRTEFQIRTVCE